jgi:hypothetical protein
MSERLSRALLILVASRIAIWAQQKGQYLPGSNGLNAGIQPAPGFSYANEATVYWATSAKGPNGQSIPSTGSYDLDVDQNIFMYTSPFKLFGGTYGAVLDVVVATASITAPQTGVSAGGAGLSDTYVQPFTLGYQFPRIDFSLACGFAAPTGRYHTGADASNNIGSGYWGNDISAGATVYLTKNHKTSLSAFSLYEFHTRKHGSDIAPGQDDAVEWGLGQLIPAGKNFLQVGAVGYGQWQTTASSGSVVNVIKNSRYSVLAIGLQVSFVVPKWNFSLFFRYDREFDSYSPRRGNDTDVLSIHQLPGYQMMLAVPRRRPTTVPNCDGAGGGSSSGLAQCLAASGGEPYRGN